MIGRLYYRTRDPELIERMPYHRMKYWDEWNLAIEKGQKDAIEKANLNK